MSVWLAIAVVVGTGPQVGVGLVGVGVDVGVSDAVGRAWPQHVALHLLHISCETTNLHFHRMQEAIMQQVKTML